ncbi:hypothetical protein [Phycicoccus jejuensis]|uniref:hypothetical protein n=1 Tax=Phycicoccus jejuensis TaxID=367299 RepID=UPI0004C3C077|nr:hypothetical protein [Phycicoccus jejuensis]
MEPFAEVLAAGGRSNSLGRAGEVLALLRDDPARLDELVACISHDDPWVRMRAVDTVEKLVRERPALGQPYLPHVLDDLARSGQPSVQWHVAQLLALLGLDDDQRARAVRWLTDRLRTADVDWIVAAQSMATLVGLHHDGHVATDDVVALLEVQTTHRSASVRRKAAGFLTAVRERG